MPAIRCLSLVVVEVVVVLVAVFAAALSFLCPCPFFLVPFPFPSGILIVVVALVVGVVLWFTFLVGVPFGVCAFFVAIRDFGPFCVTVVSVGFYANRLFLDFVWFTWVTVGAAPARPRNPDALGSLCAGAFCLAARAS